MLRSDKPWPLWSWLLLLFLFMIFTACKEQAEFVPVPTNDDRMNGAQVVVHNFEARGFTTEKPLWVLKSKEAYIFHEQGQTIAFDLDIEYDSGEDETTRVTGKKGTIDNKTRTLKIEGDVEVVTSTGRELYTEYLTWFEDKQVLFTDAHVKIIMPEGDTIEGEGLKADQKLNRMVLKGGRGFHSPE